VENQDLKNQLAHQKEKICEKDEALKVKEETIAELKSLLATEEYQRDKIQKKYDILKCPLDHVPDEVQLSIFKFLGTEDLMHCSQVSKRLRRICQDETIMKKVNLYEKVVPSEFIAHIHEYGCKYINLRSAKIVGPLQLSRKDYNVKYLNLSNCTADQGVLEKLISSCKSLQKLSLASLELDSNAVFFPHQELHTLDLNAFKGLDLELMTNILSCEKLTDVSFRYIHRLSNDLVQYLVENLSSDIKKVSLGGIHCLTDQHVKTLEEICKKIEELELCGCNISLDVL
jgi:F-box and leucine-rich repeat protein 1 (S-phase kinase-associated protein 2)